MSKKRRKSKKARRQNSKQAKKQELNIASQIQLLGSCDAPGAEDLRVRKVDVYPCSKAELKRSESLDRDDMFGTCRGKSL